MFLSNERTRRYILSALVLIGINTGGCLQSHSQNNSSNNNDKPLPKMVLTHAMGMMPAVDWYKANDLFPLNDFALSRPPHQFNRVYGGKLRMMPLGFMFAYTKKDGTYNFNENFQSPGGRESMSVNPEYLEWVYQWDLEWAERMGIDGFGLCLSGNEASYPHAFNQFKTLEKIIENNPDTKIRVTIIICGDELPNPSQPDKYEWLKRFCKEFKDSPAWLRHNGRIVLMGYKSVGSYDTKHGVDPDYVRGAVQAHKDLIASLDIGNPIMIYDGTEYVPGQISEFHITPDPELLGPVTKVPCEEFEGLTVWGGVIPDEIYPGNYRIISDEVNRQGKCWGMPILNIHSGTGQFHISKPGVERLIDTWNFADETDAQLTQIVTWNDSYEATCFAPSTSINYAFTLLNEKFAYKFKHGEFPKDEEDKVFLFYRKYHPTADPYLYPRATVERDRNLWGENDDMLHVLVFAKDAGTIHVSGTSEGTVELSLQKGYNEFKLKTAINEEIAARIYRNNGLEHELISPERVTDRPYREDLVPWGWSSECRKYYDQEFGSEFRPISYYSQRYNDGIPDWFRLHYFGTTELPAGGLPNADPDGDCVTNLQEYLLGEDPTQPNSRYEIGFVWDELPNAFTVKENQPFTPRVNLNPYPDKKGKLVHAFLYTQDGVLDGSYPHMNKWHNIPINGHANGWSLRNWEDILYYRTSDDALGMDLPSGYTGIYRFWSPMSGHFDVKCRLKGLSSGNATLYIMLGDEELGSAKLQAGQDAELELTIDLESRDKLDFIIKPDGYQDVKVVLYPEIKLLARGGIR